eukprot:gene40-21_t
MNNNNNNNKNINSFFSINKCINVPESGNAYSMYNHLPHGPAVSSGILLSEYHQKNKFVSYFSTWNKFSDQIKLSKMMDAMDPKRWFAQVDSNEFEFHFKEVLSQRLQTYRLAEGGQNKAKSKSNKIRKLFRCIWDHPYDN